MFLRFRFYTALLTVLVMLLALTPPRTAMTESNSMTEAEAVGLLRAYSIVRGDPSGALNLAQKLTRAQAAALFVRSMGSEDLAKAMADQVSFADTQGHWAAGEIAMGERLGLMRGDGDGNFRPDSDITYAEVLTVLLRMVKQEPEGDWQPATIMAAASRLGIAPAGVEASAPAVRGRFFWSLATAINRIPLPSGETLLQKYVDSRPPELTLDRTALTTTERTTFISGKALGATRVTVAGKPASFSESTGQFTYTTDLQMGINRLTVEAFDLAGNKVSALFTAERRADVSRIEITGPTIVRSGTSTRLSVLAFDARGNSVPLDGLQVEMTGDLAAFSLTATTLTTGTKTGRGVLTLRAGNVQSRYSFDVTSPSSRARQLHIASVNEGRAPAVGTEATVKVHVLDQDGNLVADDYWRTVSLTASGLNGVTITPGIATTQAGVATFSIKGIAEGMATLSANSSGLTDATETIEFLSNIRVVLWANPIALKPDGTSTSTIRATLQDENGRTMWNSTSSDILVSLSTTGSYGQLADSYLTIPRGYSSSQGYDGIFRAGVRPGTATITGKIESTHKYSVKTLTLPVSSPLPGVKLQVTYPTTRQTPGAASTITVRVLDAQNNLVTSGSYAFQFIVSTSNGEPLTASIPEGVDLTFPNSSLRPVDDGRLPTDPLKDANSVVGRTYLGTATLNLRYNKSGILTLTPRLVGPTDSAYNGASGLGPASGSTGMSAQPFQVTFAGSPAAIKLTVDSALGRDQAGGAVSSATTMTVRAQVVDASGTPIPGYSDYITLTRSGSGNGVTSISGLTRKATVNGKAEFTLQSTGTPGFDLYTATAVSLSSQSMMVSVRNTRADTPTIAAIRGVREGDPAPVTGYVGPDMDYMEIQLHPQQPPNSAEPHFWASAKVYGKGESTPFFTTGFVDLKSDLAVIRIPKSSLRQGSAIYEVVINNGAGDTARSPDLGLSDALNAVYNVNYKISSGFYDAETGKLVLTTSGLVSGGNVAKEKLSILKGNSEISLADEAVSVVSVSSTSTVLQLGTLGDQVNPDTFNGAVTIRAQDGWFTSADGAQVATADVDSPLKPMAVITHAMLDPAGKRLYLYGTGFTQGTLTLSLVKIQGTDGALVALRPGTATTTDRVFATTDSLITITLAQTTLDAINALRGPILSVIADTGWLKTTSGSSTYKAGAIAGTGHPVYIRTVVSSAQYDRAMNRLTIRGSGFAGATLHPDRLIFRASGASTTWRPASTSAVVASDDTSLVVILSDTDASAFEYSFGGRNVFMNTDSGWLTDAQDRSSAPIPQNSVLFSVAAR